MLPAASSYRCCRDILVMRQTERRTGGRDDRGSQKACALFPRCRRVQNLGQRLQHPRVVSPSQRSRIDAFEETISCLELRYFHHALTSFGLSVMRKASQGFLPCVPSTRVPLQQRQEIGSFRLIQG